MSQVSDYIMDNAPKDNLYQFDVKSGGYNKVMKSDDDGWCH